MRVAPLLCSVWASVLLSRPTRGAAEAPQEGKAPCLRERALDALAVESLESGRVPSRESLRASGSDLPSVRWWRGEVSAASAARRWLERLRGMDQGTLVCGAARRGGRLLWLAGWRGGALRLASMRVEVWLAEGFDAPRLYALDATGRLERLGLDRMGPRRWAGRLPPRFDALRPLRLQLMARGPRGARPVAERDVGGLWHPPWSLAPMPDRGMEQGRGGLPAAIALWREARGVGAVRPNRLLGRLAAERALRVCARLSGPLSHESVAGEGPVERLAVRGLRAERVGEALARGASVQEAFDALMRSPSHVAVLAAPRWTDGGWALRPDERGGWCLAILLSRWPRPSGVRFRHSPWASSGGGRFGRPRAALARPVVRRARAPRSH